MKLPDSGSEYWSCQTIAILFHFTLPVIPFNEFYYNKLNNTAI